MIPRPPRSTRTYTLLPFTPRFRSIQLWSRDMVEAAAIRAQAAAYDLLDEIRPIIPDGPDLGDLMPFYGPLIALSGFDLGQGRLPSFSSYRFQNGRAHVCTPVTNAHFVFRLPLATKNTKSKQH